MSECLSETSSVSNWRTLATWAWFVSSKTFLSPWSPSAVCMSRSSLQVNMEADTGLTLHFSMKWLIYDWLLNNSNRITALNYYTITLQLSLVIPKVHTSLGQSRTWSPKQHSLFYKSPPSALKNIGKKPTFSSRGKYMKLFFNAQEMFSWEIYFFSLWVKANWLKGICMNVCCHAVFKGQ